MKVSTVATLITIFSVSLANPLPADGHGPGGQLGCGSKDPTSDVTVTHKDVGVDGQAVVSAASCKPQAGEECSLSHTISYTVSKSVSIGVTPFGQNGKGSVIGTSISVSVSWSTAKGTLDGSGSNCPVSKKGADQWTCALDIIPSVARVSGKQTTNTENNHKCDVKEDQDYTVDLPIVNKDGNPNVRTELCACPDQKGWASPGAPPKCATPCATAGS